MNLDKFKSVVAVTFNASKIPNVILCTAIADALGMPFEGLKRNNAALIEWDGKTYLPSRPRPPTYYGSTLKVNPGQFTDDSQMSIMVAESLVEHKRFNPKDLSERYVDWIYSGRARGYGGTTKRAVDKLKEGVHWTKSGVDGSIGNGTAMRAAPFGAFYANKDFNDMYHAVKIDSAMTHRSVDAEAGALSIAISTYLICRKAEAEIPAFLAVHLPECDLKRNVFKAYDLAKSDLNKTVEPAIALEMLGTGCDVRQTVAASMYCLWRFDNYAEAIVAAIRAGSDADTTAAITGAMFGAKTKLGNIPSEWVKNVESSSYLRELDTKLVE